MDFHKLNTDYLELSVNYYSINIGSNFVAYFYLYVCRKILLLMPASLVR